MLKLQVVDGDSTSLGNGGLVYRELFLVHSKHLFHFINVRVQCKKRVDLTSGRTLVRNRGILVSKDVDHAAVVAGLRNVLADS